MKVYKLEYSQFVNKSINEVFDFFSNPENLSLITPNKLDFNIMTPCPIEMKDGQLIDYTIKIMAKKIRWRTMITQYNPPNMFIDQQLLGPYSMWHHKHIFIEKNGGVEIIDRIHYSIPFGFLGQLVNYLFINRDLNNIFEYRKKIINQHFENKEY